MTGVVFVRYVIVKSLTKILSAECLHATQPQKSRHEQIKLWKYKWRIFPLTSFPLLSRRRPLQFVLHINGI